MDSEFESPVAAEVRVQPVEIRWLGEIQLVEHEHRGHAGVVRHDQCAVHEAGAPRWFPEGRDDEEPVEVCGHHPKLPSVGRTHGPTQRVPPR